MKTVQAYVIYTVEQFQVACSITLNANMAKARCNQLNKSHGYKKYWYEPIIISETLAHFEDRQ